jgi:hypothetical protein
MMMPANFSAVSENEMTYVMGGSVADYLAPVMGKKEWSNFSKNLVTIIGNSYLNNFVANTVGTIFNGTYTPGDVLGNFGSDIAGVWGNNYSDKDGKTKFLTGAKGVLNVGLNIAGNLAAIYNLGFGTVKNAAEKAAIAEFSAGVATV